MEQILNQILSEIKEIKENQNRLEGKINNIETKLDELEPKNPNILVEIISRIDKLEHSMTVVEAVSGKNMADIATLKLIK